MAGLSSAHLRRLADELDAEEEAERRNLADAETQEERDAIRARLDRLEAENAELTRRLAADDPPPPASHDDDNEEEEEEEEPQLRMRRGRKRGQVYQDRPGEPGYVYQGEDEPDLVPVEEDAA